MKRQAEPWWQREVSQKKCVARPTHDLMYCEIHALFCAAAWCRQALLPELVERILCMMLALFLEPVAPQRCFRPRAIDWALNNPIDPPVGFPQFLYVVIDWDRAGLVFVVSLLATVSTHIVLHTEWTGGAEIEGAVARHVSACRTRLPNGASIEAVVFLSANLSFMVDEFTRRLAGCDLGFYSVVEALQTTRGDGVGLLRRSLRDNTLRFAIDPRNVKEMYRAQLAQFSRVEKNDKHFYTGRLYGDDDSLVVALLTALSLEKHHWEQMWHSL